jgi:hypothetical protein
MPLNNFNNRVNHIVEDFHDPNIPSSKSLINNGFQRSPLN